MRSMPLRLWRFIFQMAVSIMFCPRVRNTMNLFLTKNNLHSNEPKRCIEDDAEMRRHRALGPLRKSKAPHKKNRFHFAGFFITQHMLYIPAPFYYHMAFFESHAGPLGTGQDGIEHTLLAWLTTRGPEIPWSICRIIFLPIRPGVSFCPSQT